MCLIFKICQPVVVNFTIFENLIFGVFLLHCLNLFRLGLLEKKDGKSLKEIMQWTIKNLADGISVKLYTYLNELCKFYFFYFSNFPLAHTSQNLFYQILKFILPFLKLKKWWKIVPSFFFFKSSSSSEKVYLFYEMFQTSFHHKF